MTKTKIPAPLSYSARSRSPPNATTAASMRVSTQADTWLRRRNGVSRFTATARPGAPSRTRPIARRSWSAGWRPSVPNPPTSATAVASSGPARPPPFRNSREPPGSAGQAGPRAGGPGVALPAASRRRAAIPASASNTTRCAAFTVSSAWSYAGATSTTSTPATSCS